MASLFRGGPGRSPASCGNRAGAATLDKTAHPARRLRHLRSESQKSAREAQGDTGNIVSLAAPQKNCLVCTSANPDRERLLATDPIETDVGRDSAKRKRASVVDQKAEFSRQCVQIVVGGERGFELLGGSGRINLAHQARLAGSP